MLENTKMISLTEGLEDYLEAILICSKDHSFVRTKHVAERLCVKSPSVHSAIKELVRRKLVMHEPYGHIELTQEGRKEAEFVYERHKTLFRLFFNILALPSKLAESSACQIEHYINKKTLDRIIQLLDFLESQMKKSKKFADELKEIMRNDR